MDTLTGERSLLVSAEKLENVLPSPRGKQSQAAGAERRPCTRRAPMEISSTGQESNLGKRDLSGDGMSSPAAAPRAA